MMAFKRIFYIPSFFSTSIDPAKHFFNCWSEAKYEKDSNCGYQNVIFEIDLSHYPNFSTLLLTPDLTGHCTERECLISCYNIYRWTGYRLVTVKGMSVPCISLRVEKYEQFNDGVEHRINAPSQPFPEQWFHRRSSSWKSRNKTPEKFNEVFADACRSYKKNRNDYPLTWLNADFQTVHPPLVREGTVLDGAAFLELEKKQGLKS